MKNLQTLLRHIAAKRRNMHGQNPDSDAIARAADEIDALQSALAEAQKPKTTKAAPAKKASS